MDGFARRKEQSKEDIRKAAWELFSQFGVDKVSMMDIANKAGVSQATIYNNFGSKDALVREFVAFAVESLTIGLQNTTAIGCTYQEKMARFFQFISAMMEDGKLDSTGSPVFTSNIDLLNDPAIKKIRVKAGEEMIALLLTLIEEGRNQGQVNPELSDEALRLYFTAIMDIFPSVEFRSLYSRRPGLVEELEALILHGLNRSS